MKIFAAVITGKGSGAIATVQVFGKGGERIIKKIFKSSSGEQPVLETGKVLLGEISDGDEVLDQVIVGCEGADSFAINCHGNPLIVAALMELLGRNNVQLITAEQLLYKIFSAQKELNSIEIEAKLAEPKAKTLEGTKIIAYQVEKGLNKVAQNWLENIETLSLEKTKTEVETILKNSQTAKLMIYGTTIVLAGPPNTGKSTLLNYLAGRQKAIVTDIKGTTRDWVSAECRIGQLYSELIDTAGLYGGASEDELEKAIQEGSAEVLENVGLVLLVLDNSQSAEQLEDWPVEKIADKKVLTVLNKIDLPGVLDANSLPKVLSNTVQISAKFGTGIEKLADKIQEVAGISDFDFLNSVCFTTRQEQLLEELKTVKSRKQAASVITELLNG